MEEIVLIQSDSSDIYEFSSKQVSILDDKWEGKWAISTSLGSTPIFDGPLAKNTTILNDDSLVGEDYKISYEIFEGDQGEKVNISSESITDGFLTINGSISDELNNPVPERYAYITVAGVFVKYSRTILVKSDLEGNFTGDIDLNPTIKIPENSFFIFQITPSQSEQLEVGTYYVSVQITHKDDNDVLIFRKEVLQAKLKIKQQGIIN